MPNKAALELHIATLSGSNIELGDNAIHDYAGDALNVGRGCNPVGKKRAPAGQSVACWLGCIPRSLIRCRWFQRNGPRYNRFFLFSNGKKVIACIGYDFW